MDSALLNPYVRLTCYLFLSFIVAPILIKKAANSAQREGLIFGQYVFLGIGFSIALLVSGRTPKLETAIVIFLIGILNGLGAYAQWRAYAVSLSLSAVVSNLSGLLAIALDWTFNGATAEPRLIEYLGVTLTFGSTMTLALTRSAERGIPVEATHQRAAQRAWLGWCAAMVLLQGSVAFLLRWFASHGTHALEFFSPFYMGALLAASTIALRAKLHGNFPWKTSLVPQSFGLACAVVLGSGSYFWTLSLLSQSVVQPVCQIAGVLGPALIAFFLFGERRSLTAKDYVLIALAISGAMMVL